MESKLGKMVSVLHRNLSERKVPHALIGAMALSLYGVPRYTADIDFLADQRNRDSIVSVMKKAGFEDFQNTENFAQFDSELGVYGKVDFMFVHTDEGRAILERAIFVEDDIFGRIPVVQPTDYAILKFMAIANNPDRKFRDIADLEILFKASAEGLINLNFTPVNAELLKGFAGRFGVAGNLESLLPLLNKDE